ncbi:SGNH/GDSL hydrolase family protein [Paraburkholderia tropica]|uniref:SGNH/GDSL hydrolase family protein n=1 Tax=Paraburkholderia tropica TaxID=92647 RepID=UPI002AB67ACB|nr:SGNH/GDSL hydrolase family protein [Paraburkholderia tropica]
MTLGCTAGLSACGGGGGGDAPAVAQASSAPNATPAPVVVDAEGDSTMYGNEYPNGATTPVRSASPAPEVAAQTLQSTYQLTVTVENNGSPGTTVAQNLAGHVLAPLAARLATDSSRIVIENFAINDCTVETVQQFHDDLTQWVNVVRSMGKIPVLEEPNPVTRAGFDALPSFVAMVNQVGTEQNVTVIQQYAYIQSLPSWQAMLTDGVHPNDALYAIKGQREAAILAPLINGLK